MERWFSLFQHHGSPLVSAGDAISCLHGDRCQEAAGPLGRKGHQKEQPRARLCTGVCECVSVCVGVCVCAGVYATHGSFKSHTQEMSTEDKRGCSKLSLQ